mmetsp:Transcript_21288/g.37444  ORF Transcript_21288/g.37444 Transcript_21288/m.37444 type:complete len:244 (-) Transcript_21288:1367-2098(-)
MEEQAARTGASKASGKRKQPPTIQHAAEDQSVKNDDKNAPLPDSQKTKDLMNRLHAFLPQLQAANQVLTNDETKKEGLQVDVNLELDGDSNEDDEDDDDSNGNINGDDARKLMSSPSLLSGVKEVEKEQRDASRSASAETADHATESNGPGAPSIQLQFAVGDMTGNPMMKILGSGNTDSDDDGDDDSGGNDEDQDTTQVARIQAVSRLLSETKDPTSTTATTGLELSNNEGKAQKKQLIKEL